MRLRENKLTREPRLSSWHKALWYEWKMPHEGYPLPSLVYYLNLLKATEFLHGYRRN